jgi:two-component system, chemotaxis family, sensor kinase CheA
MQELEKLLEQIAAGLILVDVEDLPALAGLHDSFQQFSLSSRNEHKDISIVGDKCADMIENIILNAVDNKEAAHQVLIDAVEGLQRVVRDNRNITEVGFPDELELDFGHTAESGKITESDESFEDNEQGALDNSGSGTLTFDDMLDTGVKGEESGEDEPDADTPVNREEYTVNLAESDTSLLGDFLTEGREHMAVAEQCLMDLETGEDYENSVNAIFRAFHTIKGAAGFLELKPVLHLSHESETLLDMARKGTLRIEGEIADTAFDAIDSLRKLFDGIEQTLATGEPFDGTDIVMATLSRVKIFIANPASTMPAQPEQRVGDILINKGMVTQNQIDSALSNKASPDEKLGETLVKQGLVEAKSVAKVLREQKQVRKEKVVGTTVKDVVKIDTERLDMLVDTIGELVIAESMVGNNQEILSAASSKVSRNISHLNKITRELQEMGMAMRMVPVKPTFQKLTRAVRDLTKRYSKNVELITIGDDTEVDRSIVENIGDPLMHMIRNAMDHGLETPEERKATDKPELEKVWLRAFHKGGNIYFEIEDDGKGLNKERILAKARERGLIDSTKELTDKEIYNLILLPGFSTAQKITDISGRGVGMDVVKKNIDKMRGQMDIESVPGKGSKFTMKLPLTLAIIDGMLVSVENEKYIIPTLSVVESLSLTRDMIATVSGKDEMVNLRGDLLPLVRINQLFELSRVEKSSDEKTVVVVEGDRRQIGLVVDTLLGQRQTVIKSLGSVFEDQKWISGGAILSDGTIGLILDVGGITDLVYNIKDQLGAHTEPMEKTEEENLDSLDNETISEESPESEQIDDVIEAPVS